MERESLERKGKVNPLPGKEPYMSIKIGVENGAHRVSRSTNQYVIELEPITKSLATSGGDVIVACASLIGCPGTQSSVALQTRRKEDFCASCPDAHGPLSLHNVGK